MSKTGKSFFALALTLAFSLAMAPGSAFASCVGANATFNFGDTVTQSCTFDSNMSGTTGHGLIIGAADITIDGNGYFLDGVAPGNCNAAYRAGIYNYDPAQTPYAKGYDNVTIKNLEIKNFCNGIEIISAAPISEKNYFVKENTIECCDIHHNGNPPGSWTYYGDGVSLLHVSNSTIKKCKLHDGTGEFGAPPGGCGIYLEGGDENVFTENIITDNHGTGIFIRMYPEHNIITHNYVARNLFAGIRLMCVNTRYTECEYNYSTDNECAGIMVAGPENTIRYNTSTDNKNTTYGASGIGGVPPNGWGIVLARSAGGNNISFNTACANQPADIDDRTILGNSGASNACDNAVNWNDTGATGCTYGCSEVPDADFAADITSGSAPLVVSFTDTSTPSGEITSWRWVFGDCSEDSISEDQNPSHTYNVPGIYTVRLQAAEGDPRDEEVKTGYIEVSEGDPCAKCDLNYDSVVNFADLGLFKSDWRTQDLRSDFNGDGKVDRKDYRIFRDCYGWSAAAPA